MSGGFFCHHADPEEVYLMRVDGEAKRLVCPKEGDGCPARISIRNVAVIMDVSGSPAVPLFTDPTFPGVTVHEPAPKVPPFLRFLGRVALWGVLTGIAVAVAWGWASA